ncbi:MAG: hypothetical protein V2I33_22570 [Kangiellaceae bacterium]|nr:hypothetical protein [Kangiellaceae bacterium]
METEGSRKVLYLPQDLQTSVRIPSLNDAPSGFVQTLEEVNDKRLNLSRILPEHVLSDLSGMRDLAQGL